VIEIERMARRDTGAVVFEGRSKVGLEKRSLASDPSAIGAQRRSERSTPLGPEPVR
jgi:hypothetical protein